MPTIQSKRNLIARMKLIPIDALIRGKKLLLIDDSIVRGTQLRDNVHTFYECGAKEVHARISCPPLVYSCPFIGFTSSKSDLELISRRIIQKFEGDPDAHLEDYATTGSCRYCKMVKEIADQLGLTTLQFSKLETLVESIGLPKERLCTHCFDGTGLDPAQAYAEDHKDNGE